MKVLKVIAKIVTVIMALIGTFSVICSLILFKTKNEEWTEVCQNGSDVMFGE